MSLSTVTDRIRELVHKRSMSWLAATFAVTESMTTQDAQAALKELLFRDGLSVHEADMCQMLAQRLGVELEWEHVKFNGDGIPEKGRGSQ